MNFRCQPSGDILSIEDNLRLGVGGEGAIYRLPHKPELAAKIYHPGKMNAERASKLRAMLANAPHDPVQDRGHASIAWPVELVTSLNGNEAVAGFLMPRLQSARPISDLYDVTERHARFPLFSYDYLCRTATNLASAVRAIHKSGYVIGDVNESNILVTEKAMVTLVDTDSFQVTEQAGGRVYRCPVGTDMFTPPELLGENFEQIDRSQEHDLFGLAVLIFQLLMEGTRPFAGTLRGVSDPPEYIERLARGYFPYGGNPMCEPQAVAPPFEMLHPRLQELFRRCFVEGHSDPRQRPDAETWYRALKKSEEALVVCSSNSQHHYFDHCAACPWCNRAERVSRAMKMPDWDPFPSREKAHAFVNINYAAGQSSANAQWSTVSIPAAGAASPGVAPPSPSSFSASANTVTLGQAVTLQWTIPHAQTVQIKDQSGRSLFAGNSSNGFVTVYPTKNKTYHITASGPGVVLPNPIVVSVTQAPQPVTLRQISLELNQTIPLKAAQVRLRACLPLNEVSIKLSSPLRLKRFVPLKSYFKLKRVSVDLKNYTPLLEAAHDYSTDRHSRLWPFPKRF
jgi:serine/threonine protein kinase